VVFVLATTDPQKLPATILSRCQRYDFKRITLPDMVAVMRAFTVEDALEVEEPALRYIASVSDGAMRDALSILDQCISFYANEPITLDKVLTLLGAVDSASLFGFVDALRQFDSLQALMIIDGIVRDGMDVAHFAADITGHCRNLLIASQTGEKTSILDHSDEMVKKFIEQGKKFTNETLLHYIRAFSELQNELRYAAHGRLALEVCALRLCCPEADIQSSGDQTDMILQRLSKLEQYLAQSTQQTPIKQQNQANQQIKPPPSGNIKSGWLSFCQRFGDMIAAMLSRCNVEIMDNGMVYILCRDQTSMRILKDKQAEISDGLVQQYGLDANTTVVFEIKDAFDKRHKKTNTDDGASLRKQLSEQLNIEIGYL